MSIIKNKRIMLIVTFTFIIIVGIIGLIKKSYSIPITDIEGIKERADTYYNIPMISIISVNNKEISVRAGYYKYGDIIRDGEIDEYDVKALDKYLSKENTLDNSSITLSDINNDGEVNKIDLNYLNNYLKETKNVKYDVKKNSLNYCLNTTNDSSTCQWKESNKFNATSGQKYYIFVKDKKTNEISTVYEYTHKEINYNGLEE